VRFSFLDYSGHTLYYLRVQAKYHEVRSVSSPKSPGAPFSDEELAAWHGMLSLYSRVMRELDRELLASHRISVREFDVLITLVNAPDQQLRMSGLAQQVMLTPSGLTRLVERLERARLVERQADPGDARSFRAVLTDAGKGRLDEARTTHNAVIRRRFTDRLGIEELRELGAYWEKVRYNEG
jgi:DNA-binding MarR family transcriptional regulator